MKENGVTEHLFQRQFCPRSRPLLNAEQQQAVKEILEEWVSDFSRPCLIKGVTGSGKTEVYMELISHVLEQGKQVILLIPEIALTYQNVSRFYARFGDEVSPDSFQNVPGRAV